KAEKEMPKWIVLEFGTREHAEKVPKEFHISYKKRPDKQALIGPSSWLKDASNLEKRSAEKDGRKANPSRFTDLRRAGGFHTKDTYFMASDEVNSWIYQAVNAETRRHPGTRPSRIFRGGLKDSKEPIYEKFAE